MEVRFVVPGENVEVQIVIFERGEQVVPGVIELGAGRVIKDAVVEETVVAKVLHAVDEIVVLGHVVGGIEGIGNGILIRRRGFTL